MLHSKDVSITESALVVIDAQESFKLGPRWARRDNRDFEKNVGGLIELYRAAKLPVYFFLHHDDDPGFEPGNPHVRLMDFIKPRANEPVLTKYTRNIFTSTGFGTELLAKGVRRLMITGISMEQCCETSTRVAADLGYAVDFVTEATLTFPIPHHDNPAQELGVEAIRERTEYALRGRFAKITTVADIRAEVERSLRKAATA
jgi:nicotinamidase-related amidase